MSSGKFQRVGYESTTDSARVFAIRVQPETLSCNIDGQVNAGSSTTPNQITSAKVSKGNRGIGLKPHQIVVEFTATLPDNYTGTTAVIPALTAGFRAKAVLYKTGTYLGQNVRVIGISPERVG